MRKIYRAGILILSMIVGIVWGVFNIGHPERGSLPSVEGIYNSPPENLAYLPAAFHNFRLFCLEDEDGGSIEYWKCPYHKRPDYILGAMIYDYLAKRDWNIYWDELDPISVLRTNGAEWMRVWVTTRSDPYLSSTAPSKWYKLPWRDSYWGSIEYGRQILQEAANKGMRLNLVFFLSDETAHAGVQNAPPEWEGMSVEQTAAALQAYTYQTVQYFQNYGLNIEIYDIGNEIEWGILNFRPGERIPLPPGIDKTTDMEYMRSNVWNIEATLLKSAIAGVKMADPDAKIVLHINSLMFFNNDDIVDREFFAYMVEQDVPFDYAGLSLPYAKPDWLPAGWTRQQYFTQLSKTIGFIGLLDKRVLICEGSYNHYQYNMSVQPMAEYPFTPQGQALWIRDIIRYTNNHPAMTGFFYWYADWFPDGNPSSPADVQSLGLFSSDTVVLPGMSEFQVNLP